jgi:hypothetical protein
MTGDRMVLETPCSDSRQVVMAKVDVGGLNRDGMARGRYRAVCRTGGVALHILVGQRFVVTMSELCMCFVL